MISKPQNYPSPLGGDGGGFSSRIFALGEIVYDILFKDMQPVAAKTGGSVLNALVSLARVGREVQMISETGDDLVANAIVTFLYENRVNTDYINQLNGKSTLALAFLNEENEAEYQFFKDDSVKREDFNIPDFTSDDILLFGSFYGINPDVRPNVLSIVNRAREASSTIYYDPNFRAAHLKHGNREQLVKSIEENFGLADIVRGSDEDFMNLYGESSPEKIYKRVSALCPNLIITARSSKVHTFSNNNHEKFEVPQIETVSTVGAGDNFNAGVINQLVKQGLERVGDTLTISDWQPLIESGIRFSSAVCKSMDNYVPVEFDE